MTPAPDPAPIYAHPFTLVLHTSNATPPTTEEAFDFVAAHRITGMTPAQIVQAQTLNGTLRAMSVYPVEGQTKRQAPKSPPRPKRQEYRQTIRTLLALIHCESTLELEGMVQAVKQAKRLLKK